MGLRKIEAGVDIPNDVNVIIEIPSRSDPIKYEIDKTTGSMSVDRFMSTSMHYPCEYGYIPRTLSDDGDPVDVLVICPFALITGSVIRCRPIGLLRMTDESGSDAKVLAVPVNKLSSRYVNVQTYQDLSNELLSSIEHFFQHYKDLEQGKWVKVDGWGDPDMAKNEILESHKRYQRYIEEEESKALY